MLPVGIEPTVSAGERPKTYALERVATETDPLVQVSLKIWFQPLWCNWLRIAASTSHSYTLNILGAVYYSKLVK